MLKPIGLSAVLVTFLLYPYEQLRAQEPAPLLEFRLADDTETTGWQKMDVRDTDESVFVSNEASLNGSHIEKVSFYKDTNGNPSVDLDNEYSDFNDAAGEQFLFLDLLSFFHAIVLRELSPSGG